MVFPGSGIAAPPTGNPEALWRGNVG